MPSKVRFQTEYMSTFSKKQNNPTQGSRSPILKPRAKPDLQQVDAEKRKSSDNNEAGLCSLAIHSTQEPPLQHRRIADYNYNHNILKTETTKWRNDSDASTGRDSDKNPILEYDAVVQKSRAEEKQATKKTQEEKNRKQLEIYGKLAGKKSDNLRYLAIEPPMQRKRTSPYKLNHNVLKTNTINYINSSENGSSDSSSQVSGTSPVEKDANSVKRKLDFKNKKNNKEINIVSEVKDSHCTKEAQTFPASKQVVSDVNDLNMISPPLSLQKHAVQKKITSPSKLQRKKDLDDVKTKQNDRVDRALRIKAGLQTMEPPLHSHPVKSEYQRQFAWKEPIIVQMPIYAADNAGASNTRVDAPVANKKQRRQRTEYQEQFKKYQLLESSNNDKKISENKHQIVNEDSNKEGAYVEGKSPGSPDKRLIEPSQNVQPLFFPHPGYKKLSTEYKANYQSPKMFQVKNGAWKDTMPPHLHPSKLMPEMEEDHSDWFKEVLLLRKKAEQYKIRARETHYPTTFYASLEDGHSETSDVSSRKDSVSSDKDNALINQLTERRAAKDQSYHGKHSTLKTKIDENQAVVEREDEKRKTTSTAEFGDKNSEGNDEELASENDVDERREGDPTRPSTSSTDSESVDNLFKGRIDSARLVGSSEHRRHNLDRTTPSKSGAVAQPCKKFSSEIAAPLHDFRSSAHIPTNKNVSSAWQMSKTDGIQGKGHKIISKKKPLAKTHGMNVITEARHASDVEDRKRYHFSDYEDKENHEDLVLTDIEVLPKYSPKENLRRDEMFDRLEKPPRAFVQPSDVGRAYALDENKLNFVDNDMLSETSLSARDSIISDVLEHSRARRDHFW